MTARDTVHLDYIARALDVSVRQLYRSGRWHRMIVEEGMPAPISRFGRPAFDKGSIDAWLHRHHPLAPARPANDTAPAPRPSNDAAWGDYLQRYYGVAS